MRTVASDAVRRGARWAAPATAPQSTRRLGLDGPQSHHYGDLGDQPADRPAGLRLLFGALPPRCKGAPEHVVGPDKRLSRRSDWLPLPCGRCASRRPSAGQTACRGTVRDTQVDGLTAHMSEAVPDPGLTVAVLICTYFRPEELRRALEGVAQQTRPPNVVLVVLRPHDVGGIAAARASQVSPTTLLFVDEPGLVAARNVALAAASTDIMAFLDDDAVPRPDWLARLLSYYEDPYVGAVGGRDRVHHDGVPVDEGPRSDVGTLTWYGRFVALHHRGTGSARDVDHLKGVNMSIRRAYVPDIRVERSLRGSGAQVHEGTSLCLHIKQLGFRVVYDPQICVDHYEADRGELDARQPQAFRLRADRQHNQTQVIVTYFPWQRAAVHVLFAVLIGTGDAPGLLVTIRNIVRTKTWRGHVVPLLANVAGRAAGLKTAKREVFGSGVRARRPSRPTWTPTGNRLL